MELDSCHNIRKKTKREQALEIFKENKHKTRNEIFEIFIKELDTTRGTARTYLSLCIKDSISKDNTKPKNIIYRNREINKKSLKRGKAFEIFKTNNTSSRKDIIRMFINELDMSMSSAATHCSICTRQYKNRNPAMQHSAIIPKPIK